VRYNISTPLDFGEPKLIFGYERMLGYSQSFSFFLNSDAFGLPKFLFKSDSLTACRKEKTKAFNVSLDCRFHRTGENRYRAPKAAYILAFIILLIFCFAKISEFLIQGCLKVMQIPG
jgi:hypothetical protein